MPKKRGTGLMMVWCEVPADVEAEFNQWYNTEHLQELLSVPGVLNAARYEATSSGPKHLAMYELESVAVINTDAFTNRPPTPWGQKVGPRAVATTLINNVYQMIHPAGLSDGLANADMSPALQIGRMDVPAENDAEWNDWYSGVYVPNYEKVPGCIRGRRWKGGARRAGLRHGVRVREPGGVVHGGLAGAAGGAPRQRPDAGGNDPRRRFARHLAKDVPAVTAHCPHPNPLLSKERVFGGFETSWLPYQ